MRKTRVALVHQGIWDMEKLSMPLALGYIKAFAMADEGLRSAVDMRIYNFGGGASLSRMVPEVLLEETPDILAFSVFGWNHNLFGRMTETFRQLNPNGWCVFGGTHVATQAEREFRLYPGLDVVVNGEGEYTFAGLLRAYLGSTSRRELGGIKGISFRSPDGAIVTTPPQERLRDLDQIPSPSLSGAIPMVSQRGDFPYDAVTMETNRGCPYHCAFCYWGGATGQKIFSFSRERLREELELFGQRKVDNICLCDANFGMLRQDMEFLDDFLDVRAKYGYPRTLVSSWAKNKGKLFFDIVRKMKANGLHSDFTVALQSLDPQVLTLARRQGMRVNKFEDLCAWIIDEGLEAYGELIWGLPGETCDSFLAGYDQLARYVPRIATYDNLIIPNTDYSIQRKAHEFVTMRGGAYDYEHLLSHRTMSFEDNRRMHFFLFWSRLLAEHVFFRILWAPLRILAGMTQSQVLLSFDSWLQTQTDPVAQGLKQCQSKVVESLDVTQVYDGVRYLYLEPAVDDLFERWWKACILPRFPRELVDFAVELIRYEALFRPIHDARAKALGLEIAVIEGRGYYVRRDLHFNYDMAGICGAMQRGMPSEIAARPHSLTWCYQVGWSSHIDNHEMAIHYSGRTEEAIRREALHRGQSAVHEKQRHVAGLPQPLG